MRRIVEEGVKDLSVDLADVRMVDSSGIGLLISAHNLLHKVGGQFALIRPSPELMDLFKAMRMHRHFTVSGN
jgi:anti-sigma B factor antagonist